MNATAERQLPPSDRADAPETVDAGWRGDQQLREKLIEIRSRPGMSNNKIAAQIGCNVAYVSRYLHDDGIKAHGSAANFEKDAWDFVRNEQRRRASGVETTDCEVAAQLATMLGRIQRNNALGEILGESGTGKTRGIDLFCAAHPLAIRYNVRSWSRDVKSVEGALFSAVGRAGYDNRIPRAEFLVKKLMGSNRMIIMDHAEYLTEPALQWLYDFQEETNCPMPFIGTFALCKKLESDTRRASRTWLRFELFPKNSGDLIKHLISELAPDVNGEGAAIFDMCEQIAAEAGCFRSVHQQLKLAGELKSSKRMSWVDAIKAAHTCLIRNWRFN